MVTEFVFCKQQKSGTNRKSCASNATLISAKRRIKIDVFGFKATGINTVA